MVPVYRNCAYSDKAKTELSTKTLAHRLNYRTRAPPNMDKAQFIKLHLSRLVGSLAPEDLNWDHAQNLVNDLLRELNPSHAPGFTNSMARLLQDYERLFVSHGRSRDWSHFKIIIQILGEKKLNHDIAKYLTFLSHLLPDSGTFTSPQRPTPQLNTEIPSLTVAQETLHGTDPHSPIRNNNSTLQPTTGSSDIDESSILNSLQYTLIGQDTRLLSFLSDFLSIEIPLGSDKSFSHLLADVLEPALLFSTLQRHVEQVKGKENSPIKAAFTRFLESFLKEYSNFIQSTFTTNPKSLFALLDQLTDQIRNLRLLSYLQERKANLDGFRFLEEVFQISQSGDPDVALISSEIFRQIVVPYYEYIEHWIIKGSLIDENEEYFVSFNKGENHVNEIIVFDATKIPIFMHYEKSTFIKILQIGKTLIFLENYCEELDWVNRFALKYFALLFKAHGGFISMSSVSIQELIDAQYSEVIDYLVYLLQKKYHFFQHLLYLKKTMLMEASDLIENINKKGSMIFSQPAMSLTSAKLSEILDESINGSSLRNIPAYFRDRIDARILDLSHGTVGWDVFTLDYKIPEAPLEALFNHKNDSTQYLRLFNFLWSLRHFQYILLNNYMEFQLLHKNDLRILGQRVRQGRSMKFDMKRLQWFRKSIRMISIIRNRMLLLLQAVLRFVSFSLIERSFNQKIVKKVFKSTSTFESSAGLQNETGKLSVLDEGYASKCKQNNEFEKARAEASIEHNMGEITIDELTTMHSDYLKSITCCKLFREDVRGKHSNISFVDQIFAFLEITFSFAKASEEFGVLLNNYVNLYSVLTRERTGLFEDGLEDTYTNMKIIMRKAYQGIYLQKFEPSLGIFVRDLRSEGELKDLSKFI